MISGATPGDKWISGRLGYMALPRVTCRFSLRSLLIAMAVVALVWGYQWRWIRQRHDVRQESHIRCLDNALTDLKLVLFGRDKAPAPGLLSLLGERGEGTIIIRVVDDAEWELERRRVSSLFPEAEVIRSSVPRDSAQVAQ
jgi:hypothetical protein